MLLTRCWRRAAWRAHLASVEAGVEIAIETRKLQPPFSLTALRPQTHHHSRTSRCAFAVFRHAISESGGDCHCRRKKQRRHHAALAVARGALIDSLPSRGSHSRIGITSTSTQASPADAKNSASPICLHLPWLLSENYPGLHGLSSAPAPDASSIRSFIITSFFALAICNTPWPTHDHQMLKATVIHAPRRTATCATRSAPI